MNNGKIAIFSSCAGFGTYTPSLNLRDELYEGGIESSVYVLEATFMKIFVLLLLLQTLLI